MVNIRNKERQTGKTTDIIEMTEILLSMGREVVLLVHNRRALEYLRKEHKDTFDNRNHLGALLVGEANNLNFLRGHRFDTVMVDEWSLTPNQGEIETIVSINNAVLYVTDTASYKKPIFNNETI